MACSGCPSEFKTRDHAALLCFAALDMQLAAGATATGPGLASSVELCVGINTGRVIAGVIGMRSPRYRLMGDTVNTASRMSTTCPPGEIQLTNATYQQARHVFEAERRGSVRIKGKGMMDTWLLKGTRPGMNCTRLRCLAFRTGTLTSCPSSRDGEHCTAARCRGCARSSQGARRGEEQG